LKVPKAYREKAGLQALARDARGFCTLPALGCDGCDSKSLLGRYVRARA
jgi:hypothetical protein